MVPINGSNRGYYDNSEVDRLTTMASTETDQDKRRDEYQEVQRILAQDLPYVSLWYFDNVCVYDKRVEGITVFPAGGFEFLNSIHMKPVQAAALN
jgi:peptide/nickel transport system substrate-binding protein